MAGAPPRAGLHAGAVAAMRPRLPAHHHVPVPDGCTLPQSVHDLAGWA